MSDLPETIDEWVDFFADWSPEQMEELAKGLKKKSSEKQGFEEGVSKTSLSELLSPESDNFMGTGMTLQEFTVAGHLDRIKRSYTQQERPERRRRLQFVMMLSVQLAAIRARSIQATAIVETAISDVIEGDWPGVYGAISLITRDRHAVGLDFESDEVLGQMWNNVATILAEAFEGRPGAEQPTRTSH